MKLFYTWWKKDNITGKASYRQVFDSLDNLKACNLSAIFYEEPEYARMVEYHFIQTGLQKGEYCIYTTHGDDVQFIENKTADLGIDVEG